MNKIQWDIEIILTLPSTALVTFPDENKDEYYENESFKVIREFLDIDINIHNWYNRCNQIPFWKKTSSKNRVVLLKR